VAIANIVTGQSAALFSVPRDEDEFRKQITAYLREGYGLIVLDNVVDPLNSGQLCKLLTANVWAGPNSRKESDGSHPRALRSNGHWQPPPGRRGLAATLLLDPHGCWTQPRTANWLSARSQRSSRVTFLVQNASDHRRSVSCVSRNRFPLKPGSSKATAQPTGLRQHVCAGQGAWISRAVLRNRANAHDGSRGVPIFVGLPFRRILLPFWTGSFSAPIPCGKTRLSFSK
jgi:hypothetical protein